MLLLIVAHAAVSCRGLFATHYHRLSDEHAVDPRVAVSHMACAVKPPGPDGQPETVTFLYQLAEGALCSKRMLQDCSQHSARMQPASLYLRDVSTRSLQVPAPRAMA